MPWERISTKNKRALTLRLQWQSTLGLMTDFAVEMAASQILWSGHHDCAAFCSSGNLPWVGEQCRV
jgi:hypothetical protein